MNADEKLDSIFDVFDDLMLEDRFDDLNVILSLMDATNMPIALAVGILTVTAAGRSKLPDRKVFYENVVMRNECDLKGLE